MPHPDPGFRFAPFKDMAEKIKVSMQECIALCTQCAQTCTKTLYDLLRQLSDQVTPEHAAVLANCAMLCETSVHFMLSGSPLHAITCNACAEVCERCADECEDLGEVAWECVEICRRCAKCCRDMAAMVKTTTTFVREPKV
jgi:hypothetical protein